MTEACLSSLLLRIQSQSPREIDRVSVAKRLALARKVRSSRGAPQDQVLPRRGETAVPQLGTTSSSNRHGDGLAADVYCLKQQSILRKDIDACVTRCMVRFLESRGS